MFDVCIVHYSEIGTKSGNRKMFEECLARNVRRAVSSWAAVAVRRETGRLTFPLADVAPEHLPDLIAAVARVPGVAWASAARRTEPTIESMAAAMAEVARGDTGSFRVTARRSEKTLPFGSMELAREAGGAVVRDSDRPVDLHTPEHVYRIEVDSKRGYVHGSRARGPGGLPVGTAGRVVALLSGGLDSPVAAYRMAVRGCEVTALHLWNRSFSGEGVREKVLDLAEALAVHIGPLRVELVPFEEFQQEIIAASPPNLRMLMYRRAMLRVAGLVRAERKAIGTVVGDSVGQVASQTLPNLAAVYDAADPPVLAPLIGTSKDEIVNVAKHVGTYEISIRPGADCCSLLVPRHPATNAKLDHVRAVEAEYDVDALARAALADREVHAIQPGRSRTAR